ncbi:MAG: glycosyl hydrolase family 18 protein [Methanoregula sp.]|nr:glycosyl hydrolase family 18 protein [Methanoregula sp.]
MRLLFSVMAIVALLLVTAGCTQNPLPVPGPGNPSLPGETITAGNGQVPSVAAGGKVIATYWYLYPDPNDDTYPLVMQAKDRIPWTKINRLYIGFATVKDGVLTDLPTGDSSDDTARRAEMQRRIHEIVALCRKNNPDAEIFIVSNFDEKELDPEYLLAAQDPQMFAESVADYLEEYDLDGYDMDWESGQIDEYAPQLTTLLSACHDRFAAGAPTQRGQRYLLTHTVWPGVESAETVAGLEDSVDQLNLMTYGTGDKYDLVTYAEAYHDAGFPYEKMIGGLESEAGYTDNQGPDTQESVAAKCGYVRAHDLAGLFVWRIDNDMRPDNNPPAYQVTGWMSDCLDG